MLPIEIPEEFWQFVSANIKASPSMLRLKCHNDSRPWIKQAINHIECTIKCGNKFGALKPELMVLPLSVEQATSANVAAIHGDIARRITGGNASLVLDMTCGMGIDLSAIANALDCNAIGVELNEDLAQATAFNFRNNSRVTVVNDDSVKWLDECNEHFSLIFIDPARRDDAGNRVYNIHHCQPDLAELMPLLSRKSDVVMAKLSPMLDVTQTLRDLPMASELHVIDDCGECRELLAIIDFTCGTANKEAVITVHSENATLSFIRKEDSECEIEYGIAEPGMWLFEPSPALMKAQPFATICKRFGLRKLHVNTHLFVNDTIVDELPGKWHLIERIEAFSSSKLKTVGKGIGNADVATRNFPVKAEELQKRLKIKSGGMHRIIGATMGATAADEQRVLIIMSK